FRDTAGGNFTLGAFENDRLVGIATFVRETGAKERHKGRIYGVYVTSAERRNGVGRALLAALVERRSRIHHWNKSCWPWLRARTRRNNYTATSGLRLTGSSRMP